MQTVLLIHSIQFVIYGVFFIVHRNANSVSKRAIFPLVYLFTVRVECLQAGGDEKPFKRDSGTQAKVYIVDPLYI